jgi:hypothetical protein
MKQAIAFVIRLDDCTRRQLYCNYYLRCGIQSLVLYRLPLRGILPIRYGIHTARLCHIPLVTIHVGIIRFHCWLPSVSIMNALAWRILADKPVASCSYFTLLQS